MTGAKGEKLPKSVLFYSPSVDGGLPVHAHYQAEELARRGVRVTMLSRSKHPAADFQRSYKQLHAIPPLLEGKGAPSKILRALGEILNQYLLFIWVLILRPSAVVLEANAEFYAALWAWPHILLSKLGVRYVANFHDPVRGLWLGPVWFSKLSLWSAYKVYSGGLIHGEPPKEAYTPEWITFKVVPHGLFTHLIDHPPAFDLRERLGIARDAFVLLAFGLIVDRKNLDLVIRALPQVPGVVLVIAGKELSASQRPAAFYKTLADELGVGNRVFVVNRFIPDEEVSAFFAGCDAVALTYDGGFVSQSGVIQIAAQWDRPVLASAGPSPLRETVKDYGVGVFVEPDDVAAIVGGLKRLKTGPVATPADFARYRASASWAANIDGFLELLTALERR